MSEWPERNTKSNIQKCTVKKMEATTCSTAFKYVLFYEMAEVIFTFLKHFGTEGGQRGHGLN